MPTAIDTVCATLPSDFPEPIRDFVVDGIKRRLDRLGAERGKHEE